jgi:hypothetical protein
VSAESTTGSRLIACLARIAALLEKGEVSEASTLAEELTTLTAGEPEPMTEAEQIEANRSLSRCAELEKGLRQSALEALQRLGATRRSQAYRMPQEVAQTRR